jgi:hypothetical protein
LPPLTEHVPALARVPGALCARRYRTTGRIGRNFLRNAYRQIFPMHTVRLSRPWKWSRSFQMGRIDIPAAVEEEFNHRYNTVYIPTYLTVPGVLGARALLRELCRSRVIGRKAACG